MLIDLPAYFLPDQLPQAAQVRKDRFLSLLGRVEEATSHQEIEQIRGEGWGDKALHHFDKAALDTACHNRGRQLNAQVKAVGLEKSAPLLAVRS